MSTAQVLRSRFPRASENLARYSSAASKPLDEAGRIGWFAVIGVRDMAWALTRYRKEILRLIALGHTNGEIAAQLYLSVRTVESHRAHIQQKTQRGSRAELVAYARDNGLL